MPRGRRRHYAKPFDVDSSPLFNVKINPDGSLDHSAAYDPKYVGPCPNENCDKLKPHNNPCECGEPT